MADPQRPLTGVDVLVVGGGIVGICCAHFLARRGKSVAVVERGDVASGCSFGNAGLVVPSHSLPMAVPGALARGLRWMFDPESPFYIQPRLSPSLISWLWKFRSACTEERVKAAMPVLRDLHQASLALYEKFEGFSFGYARRGLLLVYRSGHGLEEGAAEARQLGEVGIQSTILDAGGVRASVPQLRPEIAGGVLYPGDAHLDPLAFVQGLAERARAAGVRLLTGTEVLGFTTKGRTITGVRTSQGDLVADQIVLAAGSWSPSLHRDLRLRIPIQAGKGYSITLPRAGENPAVPLLLMEARIAVTPLGDRLRLAGTLEMAGLDGSINERRVEAIRRGACEYLEGLNTQDPGQVWAGLRPCTPDGLPILGRPRAYDNLILATGHAMIGVSLGPISGSLVAQIACGEKPEIDLQLLHPDRF